MDEETLGRALELLYSTKREGDGMGLGLAVCEAIVTRAGGTIRIHFVLGQGTRVTLRLPATEEAPIEDSIPSRNP